MRTYIKSPVTYSTDFNISYLTNPAYAYDKDTSTYAEITAVGSFILDFGSLVYLNSLYFKFSALMKSGAQAGYISIEASSDGSSWSDTIGYLGLTSSTVWKSLENTVSINASYRYIKFYLSDTSDAKIYELWGITDVLKENSGIKISTDSDKGVILAAEQTLLSPARFFNGSAIKSLYLVNPSDDDATGFKIKLDPLSEFVTSILGSGSTGILSAAIWSYFMSTTLKLLEYSFGSTSNYAKFGDASDNYLFTIQWGKISAGSNYTGTVTFPIAYTTNNFVYCTECSQAVATLVQHAAINSWTLSNFVWVATGANGDSTYLNTSAGDICWFAFGN